MAHSGLRAIATVLLALALVAGVAPRAIGRDSRGRVAFIDLEGDLYVVGPDGSDPRKLSSEGPIQAIAYSPAQTAADRDFYTWPLWSPDGRRLGAFRVTTQGEELVDGLYVFDAITARVLNVYERPRLRPIYGYWSPDGKHMALLLQTSRGFSLSLWPSSETDQPKGMADGVPFFFDWGKDARSLLLHVGNDEESPAGHSVSLLDLPSGKRQVISLTPATFGPPSWSADGRWMAYGAVSQEKGPRLVVARGDGGRPRPLAKISERTAFVWSPARSVLAVATTADDGPLYRMLRLVEAASGKITTLTEEGAIAAFFWSPAGDRVLYARRDLERGDWIWKITDVRTRRSTEVGRFFPSRPLLMVFQYFDQYALSHRLWSPDGDEFVFTGVTAAESEKAEPWVSPRVYVVSAAGKKAPRAIANGHTAFWSPK